MDICSPDQSPPNHADIFLLVLNNTSRPLRKEFASQKSFQNVMIHRYQRTNQNHTKNLSNSSSFTNNHVQPELSSQHVILYY